MAQSTSRQDQETAEREKREEQQREVAQRDAKAAEEAARLETEMRPKIEPPEKTHAQTQLEREQLALQEEMAYRQQAEQATANLPTPGGPITGAMTGQQYAEQMGEKTVKMHFPRAFTLTGPGYAQVHFAAGIQEVPESLLEDPYLVRQGAKKI